MRSLTAEDNLIKEYELLKGEILNCINLSNRISLFSFTATIAILSFSLTLNPVRPVLCLIPLVVILPLSTKTAYYHKNMLVVSSYLFQSLSLQSRDGFMFINQNPTFFSISSDRIF